MTAEVIMYSTRFCPFCMMARRLLKKKGVNFEEISVGRDQVLWAEMEEKSGRATVPQIFINAKPVGGFDDVSQLNTTGKLDRLLGI